MDQSATDYEGMYITKRDSSSQEILSVNKSAMEAYQTAKGKGCEVPFIAYVPKEDEGTFIF